MIDPAALCSRSEDVPVERFPWGTLQWLCHDRLFPGAAQTLGLCHIQPGAKNPRHFHPNCEEVLYLVSGVGRHTLDGQSVDLTAGMTIRIPQGVVHNFENMGTETLVCLIAFNSGHRETVFLDSE